MTDRRSIYVMEFEPPDTGFTMVPNAMLEDRRLSAEARGALAWMASKPKGWRLSVSEAQEVLGIGRDKWRRIIKEARDVGALQRRSIRGADGRIVAWTHRISWDPWLTPLPEASTCLKTRHVDVQRPENPPPKGEIPPENPSPYKDSKNNTKGPENPPSGLRAPLELLKWQATVINGSGYLPSNFCSPTRARELVAAGLVTPERLRERGLA